MAHGGNSAVLRIRGLQPWARTWRPVQVEALAVQTQVCKQTHVRQLSLQWSGYLEIVYNDLRRKVLALASPFFCTGRTQSRVKTRPPPTDSQQVAGAGVLRGPPRNGHPFK